MFQPLTSLTPIKIFGKIYNLRTLQKIGQEKVDDDILDWCGENLDYICDCSTVPFYEVYRWTFRNKKTGQFVDIYIRYNPYSDKIRFNGDCKKDFIHYVNQDKYKCYPNEY